MSIFSFLLIAVSFICMSLLLMEFSFRTSLVISGILFLLLFILVGQAWPIALASIKLISGWISVLIIGILIPESTVTQQRLQSSEMGFRFIAALLFSIFVYVVSFELTVLFPIAIEFMIIGLLIFSLSLIVLAFSSNLTQQIFAWQCGLIGFQIIYSPLEGSALIAAIFALLHISISLLGSYAIIASLPEEGETV